jgi:hypothetical protein
MEHWDLLGVGADPAQMAAYVTGGVCDRAVRCTHREVLT